MPILDLISNRHSCRAEYESPPVPGEDLKKDHAGRIGDQMARILGVPDTYELACFLPVGIAKSAPAVPKKKRFDERARFNAFPKSDH